MNNLRFSIITVTFNSQSTLQDTFDSIRKQCYSNIEYIVIDGSSNDGTVELIKSNLDIIDDWISEPDQGLYDAMNKGINLATGDIIGFINSDDLFCDDLALEKVVKVFEGNSEIDGVYADLYYVNHNNIDNIIREWVSGEQKKFKYGWHPGHPTLYMKRKVYKNFGFFNIDYKLAADFEIMLRFIEKHNIKLFYLPEFFVKMRLGGATNESWNNIFDQNMECIKAFRENGLKVSPILYPFFRMIPKLLQFKRR